MNNQKSKSLFMFICLYIISLESYAIETKGTAQINIGDEKHISVLIPLKHTETYTSFTQGLIRDGIYSLGFGHRTENDDYLIGINSFYTMDEKDKSRLSIGFEASKNEFKFNANQYFGLDDWMLESNEYTKTADGFDVSLAFRPQKAPSFLGKVSYSKFEKNPELFKLGANYQPIPLLSFNLDYDLNNEDITGYIQLTYRFGETLADQLEPNNLAKYQSLQAQRLDLAKFDTNLYQQKKIVLDESTNIISPLKTLTLSALNEFVEVGETNTLQVKVFSQKNGEIFLLDDVIVKFKSDDLVLGVATSENGLARLDFTSYEPASLNIFSLSDQTQSNTITVSFIEQVIEQPIIPTPEVPPVDEVNPEVPPVDEVNPEVPNPEIPEP
ncbi:inverse autotransporter beta domain-containing protein, partial [Thorsellia anophelis]